MAKNDDGARRRAAAMLFAKLGLALALPLALIGSGVWWYLGEAVQQRALESQAEGHGEIVQAVMGEVLVPYGENSVAVFAWDEANDAIEEVLRPALGLTGLRILATDGSVVFSTNPEDVGSRLSLSEADVLAFQGDAQARIRPDDDEPIRAVGFSVPLRIAGGIVPVEEVPPIAVVQLEVRDETMQPLTHDARTALRMPAVIALVLTWLVLIALSWWQVRDVRDEATTNREMAMSDHLTGLANRVRFHERLDEAIAAAERSQGQRVGLLMLDLDGFKAINDTGGHAAGDRLLKRVSAKLEDATRLHESACRLGGDEFAIVVPQLTDRAELVTIAERLHKELDLTVDFSNGRSLRVGASIGLAVFPDDADSSDDLVSHADVGMYEVKASRHAKMRGVGVR